MLRTAIDARVSSDRQERELAIESQLMTLRAFARQPGQGPLEEFVDDGVSGATLERPPAAGSGTLFGRVRST